MQACNTYTLYLCTRDAMFLTNLFDNRIFNQSRLLSFEQWVSRTTKGRISLQYDTCDGTCTFLYTIHYAPLIFNDLCCHSTASTFPVESKDDTPPG